MCPPLKKPKGLVWYSDTPVGHNTLTKTVSRLCKTANITGFKTVADPEGGAGGALAPSGMPCLARTKI